MAALENAYLFEKDEKTHESYKKVQEKLSARVKRRMLLMQMLEELNLAESRRNCQIVK